MRRKLIACLSALIGAAMPAAAGAPLFPNSVVSNDLDFIHETDPGVGYCLRFKGTGRAEMPDKRKDGLFADDVRLFTARYADDAEVGFWVHPDVGDRADAEALIAPVAEAVGRLPGEMRGLLNRVVIHEGDATAFSEDVGRFFVMYSDNIRSRIETRDISETVFHESVHATIDVPHAASAGWIAAQEADGAFITEYAARLPQGEDMAESALFAWAMLKHPGRLPAEIEAQVSALIPNRIAFFETLFADWEPPRAAVRAPACRDG